MKKLIALGLITTALLFTAAEGQAEPDEYYNVGNGLPYTYEITHLDLENRMIYGLPVDKISDGNRRILLYTHEVDFDVEPGDRITAIWGDEEDEFVSIERAK